MINLLAAILISFSILVGSAYAPTSTPDFPIYGADLRILTTPQGGTGTSTVPTADQILIGGDNSRYDVKTLTAGSNVTIATSSGLVTISASSGAEAALTEKWATTSPDTRFIQPNSASGIIVTNSTSTNATTSSMAILDLTSELLRVDANGKVLEATSGTHYVAPGTITTSGLTMNTSRLLGRTTASSGAVEEIVVASPLLFNLSGQLDLDETAAYTWTGAHIFNNITRSTTTAATTTNAYILNDLWVATLTSALTLTGSDGKFSEYAGTSCTNQFPRSLSATGVATCATVANTDLANSTISGIALGSNLANLTATDSTLTFSGTYNGSAARTIGINLSNGNIWTAASTTFSGGLTVITSTSTSATSTNMFSTTASSTNLFTSKFAIGTSTIPANSGAAISTSTVVANAQITNTIGSTTAAAVQVINWDSGTVQRVILTENTQIVVNATSSNPRDGGKYILKLCQDPTGSRTVTYFPNALRWPTLGATPGATTTVSSAANSCTFIGMIYDALYGVYNVMGSTTGSKIN